MGVIRGAALSVIGGLLLITFVISMLLLTMSWSLNYSNVKTELGNTIKENLRDKFDLESFISERYPQMQTYCQNYDNYVLEFQGRTINIPCSVITANQSSVLDSGIDSYVERVYFQQYDCEFWDCFTKEPIPFFLVSAKAQKYWYSLFNYSLLVIAILSVFGFLLAQKKSNFFILVSILLIFASIPFAKLEWLIGLTGKIAEGLLSVFFSKGYDVFIRGIIIGAILLAIGLILKLFRVGFKISTIFVKSEEEKPKEEKPKEKVKEEQKKENRVKVKSKEKTPEIKVIKKKIIKKKTK